MSGTAFPRRGFLSDWAANLIKAWWIQGGVPLWFGPETVSISPGMPQGHWSWRDHQADSSPWKEAPTYCRHVQPLCGVQLSKWLLSALCSWVLRDDFPSIPKVRLTWTVACLTRLKSPGDGTRLGSCSVAAHRGEYFEAAHSLFRLRECNGSYYLFCLSNCFSLLLNSILGLMTYWWVFGQTAWNSFSGAQTSSPTLRLWAQSCDGESMRTVNELHVLVFHRGSFQLVEKLDSLCVQVTSMWLHHYICVSCGKMYLLLWSKFGSL